VAEQLDDATSRMSNSVLERVTRFFRRTQSRLAEEGEADESGHYLTPERPRHAVRANLVCAARHKNGRFKKIEDVREAGSRPFMPVWSCNV
jgi:hypothetical protein